MEEFKQPQEQNFKQKPKSSHTLMYILILVVVAIVIFMILKGSGGISIDKGPELSEEAEQREMILKTLREETGPSVNLTDEQRVEVLEILKEETEQSKAPELTAEQRQAILKQLQ